MKNRYSLERYHSSQNRYKCPNCGYNNQFVRYIDQSGYYLSEKVGRCNRESKCGYHYPPKQFFSDHPLYQNQMICDSSGERALNSAKYKTIGNNPEYSYSAANNQIYKNHLLANNASSLQTHLQKGSLDVISPDIFNQSLMSYERNAFVQFMVSQFEAHNIQEVLGKYFIGTTENGRTIFWQIDYRLNIRTGKIIAYDPSTGRRRKNCSPSWIHAQLKRMGKLSENFQLHQCFFGEHLLALEPDKSIAIVESEKTAVIASLFFPSFLWLASCGKSNLSLGNLRRLYNLMNTINSYENRRIILFPDADGFEKWTAVAKQGMKQGLDVAVSDFLEQNLTVEQKLEGYDLADCLLIAGWKETERINTVIDRILNNSNLFDELETIVHERLAILDVEGNISPEVAWKIATESSFLHDVARQIICCETTVIDSKLQEVE